MHILIYLGLSTRFPVAVLTTFAHNVPLHVVASR